jgi:hypothetical protein
MRACSCLESHHWYQLQPASAWEIPFVPVGTKREPAATWRTTGTNYSLHPLGSCCSSGWYQARACCSCLENHWWYQLQPACIRLENPLLCSGWYQVRAWSHSENHHWYQLQPASAWKITFVPIGTKREHAAAPRRTTGTNYSLHPLSCWYQGRACSHSDDDTWYQSSCLPFCGRNM